VCRPPEASGGWEGSAGPTLPVPPQPGQTRKSLYHSQPDCRPPLRLSPSGAPSRSDGARAAGVRATGAAAGAAARRGAAEQRVSAPCEADIVTPSSRRRRAPLTRAQCFCARETRATVVRNAPARQNRARGATALAAPRCAAQQRRHLTRQPRLGGAAAGLIDAPGQGSDPRTGAARVQRGAGAGAARQLARRHFQGRV
jgi:hypothetical protein